MSRKSLGLLIRKFRKERDLSLRDMKDELSNFCEECKREDESVSQNLIKHGYKICDSCYTSKTIFPV